MIPKTYGGITFASRRTDCRVTGSTAPQATSTIAPGAAVRGPRGAVEVEDLRNLRDLQERRPAGAR